MKNRRNIALVLLTVIITMLLLTMCAFVTAEAKTVLVGTDLNNDTTVCVGNKICTGWFKLKGKTYYAYKSGKHELARNCYRIRKGKLYYLGDDGAVLKKSERYIILHHDGSVKHVLIAGMENILRFNADERRYEYRSKDGIWRPTGQQMWPYGMIDWRR